MTLIYWFTDLGFVLMQALAGMEFTFALERAVHEIEEKKEEPTVNIQLLFPAAGRHVVQSRPVDPAKP